VLSLLSHLVGRPWAIHGEIAGHVQALVAKEGIAGLRHLAEIKGGIHAFDEDRRTSRGKAEGRPPGIAVIPIFGTLTHHGEIVGSAETRSLAAIAGEAEMAAADPGVGSLLLNLDSPGGHVHGTPEAFAAVRAAAAKKPVVAAVNAVAASAAYYIASAASEIWITPSGTVGSIGVYALHVDVSKALEDMGEKWTFVSAGKYKVEGNPAEPLSKDARAEMQRDVDEYYSMFVRDVARGRGVPVSTVLGDFGQGRMLMARAAVTAGMADQIGTLRQALGRAGELARSPSLARSPQLRMSASQQEARQKIQQLEDALTPEERARAVAREKILAL
jgi:signal peptide peptidase SppA